MGQPVIVDDLTIIKDDTSLQPDKEFDFTKLLVGDLVEISVFVDDTTSVLTVTNLVRKDSDPTKPFEFEFSGPITGSVNNASDPKIVDSISAAGIDFDVSQLDSKINSATVGIGNDIEIKGEYNGSQQPSLTVNEVNL